MSKRALHILLITTLTLVAGCRINSRNPKRDFNPPLVAENDVLRWEVRRIHQRGRSLRVWLDLHNKTDKTLDLAYGNFQATAEGKTIRGGLYIAFGAKTTKGFPMDPKFYKAIRQPIEFPGFGRIQSFELRLTNIKVRGEDGSSELKMTVPVRKVTAKKKTKD